MHGFHTVGRVAAREDEPKSEINVTPFIDVVLVLLIVFMVAAPLSTVSVPLELPNSQAQATPAPEKPVVVSIQADLSLHVNDQAIGPAKLADALRADGALPETRILLRADKHVAYGDLMSVLDGLRRGGFAKVALIGLEANH